MKIVHCFPQFVRNFVSYLALYKYNKLEKYPSFFHMCNYYEKTTRVSNFAMNSYMLSKEQMMAI